MADQKTEKATPKRQQKAKEEGQAPSAKEFVAAAQFALMVVLLGTWCRVWTLNYQQTVRQAIGRSFQREFAPADLIHMVCDLLHGMIVPFATAAGTILAVTLALQLGATKFGFSVKKLTPRFDRLSPLGKLKSLPRQNLESGIRALALLALISYLAYSSSTALVETMYRM